MKLTIFDYKREKAVAYAREWAFKRNPKFYNFDEIGGDCTNFASQCLYAGGGVMNDTPDGGWYYINQHDRAAAWTSVPYLYRFLKTNEGLGPFAEIVDISGVKPGDIIQLRFMTYQDFRHTLLVVRTGKIPTIHNVRIATHTSDAYDRGLDTYEFQEMRCMHILGIRTK